MKQYLSIIKEALSDDYQRDAKSLALLDTLAAALKPFDGKPVSKRLATAVQKAMPEAQVYYRHEYGMFHISIWGTVQGEKVEFEKRREFLLGHERDGKAPVFTLGSLDASENGTFYGYNTWAGSGAVRRMDQIRNQFANERQLEALASALEAKEKADATIKAIFEYPFEGKYSIEKATGVKL
jgi:hypothetical protein